MASPLNIPKHQLMRQAISTKVVAQNLQLGKLLNHGFTMHQKGLLNEARIVYENILGVQSNHFDALQLLGLLFAQQNCHDRAVELMGKALKINPHHPIVNNNLGVVLRAQKKLDIAISYFTKAVQHAPNYLEALQNLATAYFDERKFDLSVQTLDKLIKIKDNDAAVHAQRGTALFNLGQFDKALKSYDSAIHIQPNLEAVHNNRGLALKKLGQYDSAVVSFDKAICINPDYPEAYNNRGTVFEEQMKLDSAIKSFEMAIHLRPDYAEAHNNLGNVFQNLQQYERAMVCREKAINIQPDYEDAIYNKGCLLFWQNQVDKAIECFDKVLDINPSHEKTWWNKSLAHLVKGDFEVGWPLFEWRYVTLQDIDKRSFKTPRWTGVESITGKTILLYSEQGFGDTIQFCRYTKLISSLGARVVLEVPQSLIILLGTLDGVSKLAVRGELLPEFDYHCSLMSLPMVFQTNLHSIPTPISYLQPDPAIACFWRNRLGKKIKPRIGLVWSGNSDHSNDQNRSISLIEFISWLPNKYEYISLQKTLRPNDRVTLDENPYIHSFIDDLNDFSDTAGLIECLDLVISVDTSVAHLAGALGKETWVLIPFRPDWRWMLDRNDSPWYHSLKLYRQQVVNNWDGVFKEIKKDLLCKELINIDY